MRYGYIICLRSIALHLCVLGCMQAALPKDHDSEEHWPQLEAQVDTTGFPRSFFDSLETTHEVTNRRTLRSMRSPLLSMNEKIVLEARWGFIRAGFGIITTRAEPSKGLAYISAKAVTNRFISAFFKVRDFVRATVDLEGLYPLFVEEHIEEGRYRKKRWAVFDHSRGLVFSNKKKREQVEAPRFSLDFLTILYYIRSRELKPGDRFSVATYVHGKTYDIKVVCDKRERVETPAGAFDCVVVEPQLVGSGRISRRDKIRLWLTDDEYHVLVKVDSKIKAGSVKAELVHYERSGVKRGDMGPAEVTEATEPHAERSEND